MEISNFGVLGKLGSFWRHKWGSKKKMTFFRPDVTFGVDAQCLLN